jgi:hypothetical protein
MKVATGRGPFMAYCVEKLFFQVRPKNRHKANTTGVVIYFRCKHVPDNLYQTRKQSRTAPIYFECKSAHEPGIFSGGLKKEFFNTIVAMPSLGLSSSNPILHATEFKSANVIK